MTTISRTPGSGPTIGPTDGSVAGLSSDYPAEAAEDAVDAEVMGLLHEHVPLSLIMDLVEPAGPDSAGILRTEGAPKSQWWVGR